jgi:hypothetical protein
MHTPNDLSRLGTTEKSVPADLPEAIFACSLMTVDIISLPLNIKSYAILNKCEIR